MEKKNKKKLFAIIGGSVLAFVLTIALSVSITLAYFGQAAQGSATVSTGGSVLVSTPATFSENVSGLIPGQAISMDIKATVKSSSSQTAYLVAIVSSTGDDSYAEALGQLVTGNIATTWQEVGYVGESKETKTATVYLYATKVEETVTATAINATSAAEVPTENVIALTKNDAKVPAEWDNNYADKTATINVTFVAMQTPVSEAGVKDSPVTYNANMITLINELLEAQSINIVVK